MIAKMAACAAAGAPASSFRARRPLRRTVDPRAGVVRRKV
jgi:hypothetical protein